MRLRFLLLMLVFAPLGAYAQDTPAPQASATPVKDSDVLSYLERAIAWHRAIIDTEQLPGNIRETPIRDKLHETANALLQKSFAYARAQAALMESTPTAQPNAATVNPKETATEARHAHMAKAMADAHHRVTDLQAQLSQRGIDTTQREKLAGALKLAEARQDLLQNMSSIFSSEESSDNLLAQINTLSQSAPSESLKSAPIAAPASVDHGLFGLSDALLTLSRNKNTIDILIKRTNKLSDTVHKLMVSTHAGLNDALAKSNALSTDTNTVSDLNTYRQSVDTLVGHYKQLSTVIIGLGEMRVLLEKTGKNLQEWGQLMDEHAARLSHLLVIRLSILALSIAIPLLCSIVAHRTIYRYAKDAKWRRQLDITRRILLVIVLIIVIPANFLTEFGSLATFAGFMTAGLAVALQTVLVSLVAHSLYFGRYGIHNGDVVKVADVTGEVLQLGMLRLYVKELKETGSGLTPTGRIVAFPNSILFQPAAFYKYGDVANKS